jgi:hypothetical protein
VRKEEGVPGDPSGDLERFAAPDPGWLASRSAREGGLTDHSVPFIFRIPFFFWSRSVGATVRAGCLIAFLCLPVPTAAQQPSSFCLQARPAARCRTFLVTEFGAYYRLDQTYGQERRYLLTGDLGVMVNLDATNAVGVTGYLSAHGAVQYPGEFYPDLGGGVAARYRRWLGSDWRVDLSAGMPIPGADRVLGTVRFPSAVLELRGTWRDYVGAAVRWEPTRYEYQTAADAGFPTTNPLSVYTYAPTSVFLTKHQLYVGAEIGRLPGAIATVVGWTLIFVGSLANAST